MKRFTQIKPLVFGVLLVFAFIECSSAEALGDLRFPAASRSHSDSEIKFPARPDEAGVEHSGPLASGPQKKPKTTVKERVQRYDPTWESLDKRPLPQWYDRAKFGIFLHWGVYSVPSHISEWFWWYWKGDLRPTKEHNESIAFMEANYPPNFQYADFAAQFHAELFNPDQWADIFSAARAKYVVLTSKHHEGFAMWPSVNSWNWNAMDVGPKRDLVGAVASSVRSHGLKFGLYHSLFEWFNPLWQADGASQWKTDTYVRTKSMPCLLDLVARYQPEVIWSDGDNGPDTYWNSTEFIAWLYNDSPVRDTVVTNDRWGFDVMCRHGDFYTCDDRYSPGHLLPHKWESCMTVDRQSWGYRREMNLEDVLSAEELVSNLVQIVSCGGNMLLNVGPTSDGRIVPAFEERLRQMGCWLDLNGEAIFDTQPWKFQNDSLTPNVWYTRSGNWSQQSGQESELEDQMELKDTSPAVYASVLTWPGDTNSIVLGSPRASATSKAFLLAGGASVPVGLAPIAKGVIVSVPNDVLLQIALRRGKWSCSYALVFKLIGLTNA